MPISIRNDVAPATGLDAPFTLRDTVLFRPLGSGDPILFDGGLYMNLVRPLVADRNWLQFYQSWLAGPNVERDVAKSIAGKFSLDDSERETFNQLWPLPREANNYKKQRQGVINADIRTAYELIARTANGQDLQEATFRRTTVCREDNLVVFSDHHMTAYEDSDDYFRLFNYDLYRDVLRYYLGTDFWLVENGDVEECVIYEPDLTDARARNDAAPGQGIDGIAYPVLLDDERWDEFLDLRYAQRERNLEAVIGAFPGYYDLVREFVAAGRYVRLAGNHDTYLNQNRERVLRDRIQAELGRDVGADHPAAQIYDVLRVERGRDVAAYVITHGHQFDPVCHQHGAIPHAKSMGEVFSECLGWAYQGPDRVWRLDDTKKWFIGNSYQNVLAREEHGTYQGGGDGGFDLLFDDVNRIKADSKDFVESVLGAEIAWEYFENTNGFYALTLEVWTGDELYKMKHLDEIGLVKGFVREFQALQRPGTVVATPKLIIGHTHEPRQNAVFPTDPGEAEPWEQPDTHEGAFYLNSGSAGRYENLIWCVEVRGDEDFICSWSAVGDRLKKITWRSAGATLVHDEIEWITP